MSKHSIIVILILLTFVITISGCTTKTATNGTFGEKSISIDSILISSNTTSNNYTDNNGNVFFYITGYLVNNNLNDLFNVKVIATTYDANGDLVATNDSAYIEPSSIPAKGISKFYLDFPDPNNNITKYNVKIINATGTLQ